MGLSACKATPDDENFGVGEFRIRPPLSTGLFIEVCRPCVTAVLGARAPLKVVGVIVQLVAIDMVDLRASISVGNEGNCHESVDQLMDVLPANLEHQLGVAVIGDM